MSTSRKLLVYRLRLKFKVWLAFQVFVPLLSVALVWPVHRLFDRPFGFERTFSDAELLFLGALLLLGAMVDIYYEQKTNSKVNKSEQLDSLWIVNLALGLVYILVYSIIKTYMVLYEFPGSGVESPAHAVELCAYASLVGVMLAAAWAGFTIHKSYILLLSPRVKGGVQ